MARSAARAIWASLSCRMPQTIRPLGKGLRDNYLQISLLWEAAAFVVDRVEFDPIIAKQRRL